MGGGGCLIQRWANAFRANCELPAGGEGRALLRTPFGAAADLLGGNPPDRSKPHPQRLARPVQRCPRCQRALAGARSAFREMPWHRPIPSMPARRTPVALRSTDFHHILAAGFFAVESLAQFAHRLGKLSVPMTPRTTCCGNLSQVDIHAGISEYLRQLHRQSSGATVMPMPFLPILRRGIADYVSDGRPHDADTKTQHEDVGSRSLCPR